jgi:hypothetical protein
MEYITIKLILLMLLLGGELINSYCGFIDISKPFTGLRSKVTDSLTKSEFYYIPYSYKSLPSVTSLIALTTRAWLVGRLITSV